jgi:hypothetical protein
MLEYGDMRKVLEECAASARIQHIGGIMFLRNVHGLAIRRNCEFRNTGEGTRIIIQDVYFHENASVRHGECSKKF